jgi:hypothetical protein
MSQQPKAHFGGPFLFSEPMSTFKTTLEALLQKTDRVLIQGMVVHIFHKGAYDGQFDCRIETHDGDPDYPEEPIYAVLDQEIEINENGVGSIAIQDMAAAEPEDIEAPLVTTNVLIECYVERPIIEEDLRKP